ncbi:hypothetical protein ACSDR0_48595 [Streptosporangium sp. G11]|uniref:hypothetical protein n=1 Tax=Streptosporangium sp. G11 TaxID=3436926 RepID=UPI003EC0C905
MVAMATGHLIDGAVMAFLRDVVALAPGSPYKVKTATGDELGRQVWSSLPRQLLLTVKVFDDGLAVLARHLRRF